MRILFSFMCVLALGLMGCSETAGTGGSGGDGGMGGDGGTGGMTGQEFPCTEQGIRDAIAEGGGPHTFACVGPTTVVTQAEIVIDNDVILDGEGNLTVDGNGDHRVFSIGEGATAELDGLGVSGGRSGNGGGIFNLGALTLTGSTLFGNTANSGGGVFNGFGKFPTPSRRATLTLKNSTVSGNIQEGGCGEGVCGVGGIFNLEGTLTVTNSTVSGNDAPDIFHWDGYPDDGFVVTATIVSSTVANVVNQDGAMTLTNTLVVDGCTSSRGTITSAGHNIESPGDTCGFDQLTDLVDVTADDLKLGPLQDNGGPTETQALGAGSVAIDKILEADCVDADGQPLTTDQRGEPRPETGGTMCDVGSVERSARDAALASYCAAVLECFPDDESCELDFVNLLWVGSGGDFAACTSAKVELVECAASLDCDKLGGAREDYFDVVIEECLDQLEILYSACEIPVK